MKITIASYKKAQVFKKDYIRHNGDFIRFKKTSSTKNHKFCTLELSEGDTLDARASRYCGGATRWTAASCQSWARFEVRDGKLTALNFDNKQIDIPHWVSASSEDVAIRPSN